MPTWDSPVRWPWSEAGDRDLPRRHASGLASGKLERVPLRVVCSAGRESGGGGCEGPRGRSIRSKRYSAFTQSASSRTSGRFSLVPSSATAELHDIFAFSNRSSANCPSLAFMHWHRRFLFPSREKEIKTVRILIVLMNVVWMGEAGRRGRRQQRTRRLFSFSFSFRLESLGLLK